MFLRDNYPGWEIKYFPDTPAGLEAIAAKEADCVIISNYRYSNIAKQCEDLHLTPVYTGVDLDYAIAVKEGDSELYSILCKASKMVPDSLIHSALTYYSTEDAKISLLDFLMENLIPILVGIIIVISLVMILLIRYVMAERKIIEEERMLNVLNNKVFVDALTSVRNKGAFNNFVQNLQDRLDNGEVFDFAIGVFDCDDLKSVNDKHGHDKGDIYLKTASRLICEIFKHSAVFRIGGVEFAVIVENEDLNNLDTLIEEFRIAEQEICKSASNSWEQVHIALGIAKYDPVLDHSINDTARRADKIMYENKRLGKEGR